MDKQSFGVFYEVLKYLKSIEYNFENISTDYDSLTVINDDIKIVKECKEILQEIEADIKEILSLDNNTIILVYYQEDCFAQMYFPNQNPECWSIYNKFNNNVE